MRKLAALSLLLAFVVAVPAFATHLDKLKKTDFTGTVSSYADDKSITIKDEKGAEKTIVVDKETTWTGADGKAAADNVVAKAGNKVKISAAELEGKWVAASVTVVK